MGIEKKNKIITIRNNKIEIIETTTILRKQLKERNECLIELEKKKRKLNRIKIKKNLRLKCKKRKLRKLKQEKAKIKQNIGTDKLKKQLFYKLKVLKKMNAENNCLHEERKKIKVQNENMKQKELEFNDWIQNVVSLPIYKKQFEKYEYNRLDVVRHLDGDELRKIGIKDVHHREQILSQIQKLRHEKNQKQIGI